VKKLVTYCLFLCFAVSANAQYFLRGVVRNDKNIPLPNAKIYLHGITTGANTGFDGSFGITTKLLYDTVTVSSDGHESTRLIVKADVWQTIILKSAIATIIQNKPKLISFTKDAKRRERFSPSISDETYFKLIENEFVEADKFPNTGFSLNVNKASYSNVRRFINMGSKVPPDAVRVEEMVNYFNLAYETPCGKDVFRINSSLTACPWDSKNNLLFLKLSAKKLALDKIPAGNFVFLIDVSGSMDMPNRLPLLKEAFQLFVKNLRPIDKVSIVTYGGMVGTWLAPTAGDEKEKINNRLELLEAAGDTPGESAIAAAYKIARSTFIPGGNNRVILATDGDFNVGQSSEKALDELITKQRESGIFLTCLGVGMGNFKDSKLQTLAKRGNGNYAYLDGLHEAEKVLVHELTETLYAVADNAFIDIKFNSARVSSYRLIGFDNKREAVQDLTSNLDGGEIGSGGSTMAIFEIVPTENKTDIDKELASLYLKFHDVSDKIEVIKEVTCTIPSKINDSLSKAENFAAAVTLFGLKLKESPYINKVNWSVIKAIANTAADKTNFLQNDFLKLIDKAIAIYEPNKRKRKSKNGGIE
jgi:Ca-activated chloride channel homolog